MHLSTVKLNRSTQAHNQHARNPERQHSMRPAAAGAARPLSHVYNANVANVDDEVRSDAAVWSACKITVIALAWPPSKLCMQCSEAALCVVANILQPQSPTNLYCC
jgi:hypothetical protein